MKKNRNLWIGGGILVLILIFWALSGKEEISRDITTKSFVADFQDAVTSSGELLAKNSEDITGPQNVRRYGLFNIKISDIVPEGTYVEKGDFVAQLDKTELSGKLNELYTELEKANSQYTQTQLDTSLELRQQRSTIESLLFDIRQKKVEIEQSAFEPPATVQRLKLDLEKLEQNIQQNRENYEIKKKQSRAKMIEAGANLAQTRNKYEKLQDLEKEFRISAPKPGMVTYIREWGGRKRKTGSSISPWDPGVATLPDLSVMESKTYINEVDIRKVKEGQQVNIGLDAFPDVQLNGTVSQVANVGEDRENSESKVFEIVITVNESDSTYRPGMTTSNEIITSTLDSVVQIPLEAIFSEDDLTFVYIKGVSIEKQEVKIGARNDEFAVIEAGLKADAEVFLTEPASAVDQDIQRLN
ncbi:MAG: efflux RND transporter periplasmic adaptor subunit [Croceimicrobium sp.]|nr:efflux RND transporter periplasmic adaptor subunit [Bacteroidota bacterium]